MPFTHWRHSAQRHPRVCIADEMGNREKSEAVRQTPLLTGGFPRRHRREILPNFSDKFFSFTYWNAIMRLLSLLLMVVPTRKLTLRHENILSHPTDNAGRAHSGRTAGRG